jgi:hypothetical protein
MSAAASRHDNRANTATFPPPRLRALRHGVRLRTRRRMLVHGRTVPDAAYEGGRRRGLLVPRLLAQGSRYKFELMSLSFKMRIDQWCGLQQAYKAATISHILKSSGKARFKRDDMRERFFCLLATIFVVLCVSPAFASFKPRLTPAEQQRYQEMMKTDRSAAHAYIDTRNYVSICSQALKQTARILEVPIQPEDYDVKYAAPDEVKMVKQAIFLWMKATIAH